MPKRKFLLADPARPEGSDNACTRERIEAAAVDVMAESAKLTHDLVAVRAGVSRRTVYRYFPDQAALRQAAWKHLSPAGGMPQTLDQLLGEMAERFEKFDKNAAAMTVAMASAEGRAIRNVMKEDRVTTFQRMLAKPTAALPERDRLLATAAIQYQASGLAWREMRDQWDLVGAEIGEACRWVTQVLLADLARRGGKPLAEGPAD